MSYPVNPEDIIGHCTWCGNPCKRNETANPCPCGCTMVSSIKEMWQWPLQLKCLYCPRIETCETRKTTSK